MVTRAVLLLCAIGLAIGDEFCKPTIDGYSYDFTSLATSESYEATSNDGIYEYVFNICDEVHGSECTGSLCQLYDGYLMEVLGYWTQAESSGIDYALTDSSNPDAGVTVTLTNGEACFGFYNDRVVNVELICNLDVEVDQLKIVDDNSQDACSETGYRFSMQTCLACPYGCNPGSGYSVYFLISLAIITVCYVGGGVVYNHKKLEKPLSESLPHPEFWAALPGYVKVGCEVSHEWLTACTSCTKSRFMEGYSKIKTSDPDGPDGMDSDGDHADLLDDDDNDLLDD